VAAIDVLMITYRRPEYVRRTLPHLLEHADDAMRVWLWHNGDDDETLDVVRKHADHPRVHRFHHSEQNVGLREPTNWLWSESDGAFVSKVDDDCLLEPGWARRLEAVLDANPHIGVLGSWRFQDEDFVPELAYRKMGTFNGAQVLQNFWVQGSGYLLRRRCIDEHGVLAPDQSFPAYCQALALAGWTNGWLYPFVREDHMDDPRSPNSLLRSDEDLLDELPLSAKRTGVRSLAEWAAQQQRSARIVQMASIDRSEYQGWRKAVRNARRRAGLGALEVPLVPGVSRDLVPPPLAQSY
jgi:glycosyltransferase involved in cell wall biosynthesis